MPHVRCNVRVDFSPGPVPGQLHAAVCYLTEEGSVFAVDGPAAVGVGQSLHLGPIDLTVGSSARVTSTPAAGPTPAAGVAAAQLGKR